jgi:hypothetical protein
MFRHVKHRETSEPHKDHWYTDWQTTDGNLHCQT